jgi:hypothetical protein
MLLPKKIFLIFCFCNIIFGYAQTGYISTITGMSGPEGYNGDEIPAVSAKLYSPTSVLVDDTGNVYIADTYNYRVRKIDTQGIIHTIAGCGGCNTNIITNGVIATNIGIVPRAMAFDKDFNIYVVDDAAQMVCKIDKQGYIYIVAGTGTAGYSGDGGQATQAKLNYPSGLCIDEDGNIFVADGANYVIRKIDTTGIIHTIAGTGTNGYAGDGSLAINATIGGITSIIADTLHNLYVCDINGNIRVINKQGIISTYIGRTYTLDSPDTISRDSCGLWSPLGLSLDSLGQLYYVDQTTARVKQINKNDTVYTVVGVHVPGYNGDNIPAIQAQIGHDVCGTAFDKQGNLYIADTDNNRIRKVTYYNPTSIKQFAVNSMQVTVYPNPAQNSLQVTLAGNNKILEINLFDLLGKEVLTPKEKVIDVSNFKNGIYFMQVKTSDKIYTTKFIKE